MQVMRYVPLPTKPEESFCHATAWSGLFSSLHVAFSLKSPLTTSPKQQGCGASKLKRILQIHLFIFERV